MSANSQAKKGEIFACFAKRKILYVDNCVSADDEKSSIQAL